MGKQIRIYLSDGTSTGIRHAEITNWSGQALACPRAKFAGLKSWPEVQRPGVYFLFGIDDETGSDAVYIGESEVVLDRLSSHISGKQFWGELIAVTSKDDNLTKAHIRYLESKAISLASAAARYVVINAAAPQIPSLPRADIDAMEEFIVSITSLLGVLGHKVLEPYTSTIKSIDVVSQSGTVQLQKEPQISIDSLAKKEMFHLDVSGLKATAERTDEGLVVLSGSEAAVDIKDSLSIGYRALREKLASTGILVESSGKYIFAKDHLFNSPSQAAAVVVGYSINGRYVWRSKSGATYGDYEKKMSDALLEQISG